ncbi:MAG: GxxExxY protein [Planctomycetota bacterium]
MAEDLRQDAETPRRQEEPDERLDQLAHDVIGAAITVHRALNAGFPESVYEEALAIELTERGIPYERQAKVNVFYRERLVGQGQIDLLVDRRLVIELKAVEQLHPKHHAQTKAYLIASGCRLGLLINFHEAVLKDGLRRIIYTPEG